MLIKVLHQEKGSKKLLAEFPNNAFELIPTVFIVLETCIFSVSSNKKAVLPQGNRAMPQVFFSVEVRQQHSLQV